MLTTKELTHIFSELKEEIDKTIGSDYTPNSNANALSFRGVKKSEEMQDVLSTAV